MKGLTIRKNAMVGPATCSTVARVPATKGMAYALRVGFVCAAASLLMGCPWQEDAEGGNASGSFVTLRVLDSSAQPATTEGGVLVSVVSRGGNAMRLSVSGGTLDTDVHRGAETLCTQVTQEDVGLTRHEFVFRMPQTGVSAFVVAVHPTGNEATVWAALGNVAGQPDSGDCSDDVFHSNGSTAVVVASLGRGPSGPTESQSAADAGEDGGADTGTDVDAGGD